MTLLVMSCTTEIFLSHREAIKEYKAKGLWTKKKKVLEQFVRQLIHKNHLLFYRFL